MSLAFQSLVAQARAVLLPVALLVEQSSDPPVSSLNMVTTACSTRPKLMRRDL